LGTIIYDRKRMNFNEYQRDNDRERAKIMISMILN